MGSSNTSFTYHEILAFIAGTFSWSVDSITVDGNDKHDTCYVVFELFISIGSGKMNRNLG